MEYIYTVMLLNKAGKEITEDNIMAVMKAAGVEGDSAKAKSLVAALDGVNIEEVIANSAVSAAPVAAAGAVASSEAPAEEKKEEKKEEAPAADAAAGLGDLF